MQPGVNRSGAKTLRQTSAKARCGQYGAGPVFLNDDNDRFRARRGQLQRKLAFAIPFCDPHPVGDDIAVCQRASGILSAADLDPPLGKIPHDLNHRLAREGCGGLRPHPQPVATAAKRKRYRSFPGSMTTDRLVKLCRTAADEVIHTRDDNLRRIDGARTCMCRIGALAIGILPLRENVLPADIIPIVDMQTKGDDIVPRGEPAKDLVGRRTGRASLRCIKLHNYRVVTRRLAEDAPRETKPKARGGADDPAHVLCSVSPGPHIGSQTDRNWPIKVLRDSVTG